MFHLWCQMYCAESIQQCFNPVTSSLLFLTWKQAHAGILYCRYICSVCGPSSRVHLQTFCLNATEESLLITCRVSITFQANFIFVHDGRGRLLNASVSFLLGIVREGSLVQQFSVEFTEVCNQINGCVVKSASFTSII